MVARLFTDVLHQDDVYQICFARRGNTNRTASLQQALEKSQQRFTEISGRTSESQFNVIPQNAHESSGLQIADYFLWALQRLYERGEDRYVAYLGDAFRYVHDMDDKRTARKGVRYTRKKPLSRAALEHRLHLEGK